MMVKWGNSAKNWTDSKTFIIKRNHWGRYFIFIGMDMDIWFGVVYRIELFGLYI